MSKKEKILKKVKKEVKGITLVALVVTIIVLLILAGVAISLTIGSNGIFTRAADAKEMTEDAQKEEAKALATLEAATNVNGSEYKEGDKTIKIPAGYTVSPNEDENNLNDGLVILDSLGNEYVWIEVPNDGTGPDYTSIETETEGTDEYYQAIYDAMKEYVGVYGDESATQNYSDGTDEWYDRWNMTWDGTSSYALVKSVFTSSYYNTAKDYYSSQGKELYTTSDCTTVAEASSSSGLYVKIEGSDDVLLQDTQGCGLTYKEYEDLYKAMLASVYKNGGFWIGRYEVGDSTITADIEKGISLTGRTEESGTTNTAVIKANQIPYNYVKYYEAENIAETFAKSGNSSLLFGIQWDLVLKYLETKGTVPSDLNSDSKKWGNYSDNLWTITNAKSKSSVDNGANWVKGAYGSKGTASKPILLSTAAETSFKKMNIYDLAGNVSEWTLEHGITASDAPCACRGGNYDKVGSGSPANFRGATFTTTSRKDIGFRVTLY